MTVSELMIALSAENQTEGANLDMEISCGYACDLLSWVMAHGKQGMAWTTVQSHANVTAVAVLMEMACVILAEGVQPEEPMLKKAVDEGLPVLCTSLTAYEICGIMNRAGISSSAK